MNTFPNTGNDPKNVDVLIIGAGINGAGLFRDLCEQGVHAVIIDKADYGSGTSAAPSRLIHGGIKYLETGELGLVAQSTLERNLLLKNAPHAVKPLATIIPMFSWFNGIPAALRTLFGSITAPRSRGAVLIEIGLLMYDLYGARHRVMPRHRFWSKSRALRELPLLTDKIVAVGTYYDAMVSVPERLVLELVQDGLKAQPMAEAHSYAKMTGCDGKVICIEDAKGETHQFKPRIVVNAAGPWIDKVNALLGLDTKLIGGTKGSHIIIDNPDLVTALKDRMVYYEADDGRICLVFAYHDRALIGSTDVFADDPDKVRCEDEEISYFLESIQGLLPGLKVDRSQIVYTYSGIRPLPAADDTAAGLVSRDHSSPLFEPKGLRDFAVISLVGGKWTTFRGFAEEVCDQILHLIGKPRNKSTKQLAIGGGKSYPTNDESLSVWLNEAMRTGKTTQERAHVLLERYGTTATDVVLAEGANPEFITGTNGYSVQEIAWIVRNESVYHVMDIIVRRSLIAVNGSLTEQNLRAIAQICGEQLGWDSATVQSEIENTKHELEHRHRVTIQS